MKLLRNPWVTGALVLAAIGVVFIQLIMPQMRMRGAVRQPASSSAPAPPPIASVPRVRPAVAAAATTNVAPPERPVDSVYAKAHFADWVASPQRDPFLLLAAQTDRDKTSSETNSPVATWTLKAIWSQTGSRLAVINHGIYGEGDEIQGYRLIKIEGDEVWFQGPTRKERLGFERRRAEAPVFRASNRNGSRP